jgi:DNA-binding beta-propeller fold protein YncE
MSTSRLFALALAAAALPAQESARFSGPTSGFLFDAPSRAIRVVMGTPGAAYLGQAVVGDLDNGSVSPDGRFAVAIADGAASLIRVAGSSVASLGSGCDGAVAAWSADSSAVAVGCPDGLRLFRASGGRAALAGFNGAKALAVDAAGGAVFAANAEGIFRIDADSARLLAPAADVISLALSGATLYAVDRAGKQVVALDNLSGSAALRIAASSANPVAVGVSPDGTRLYVAEGESKTLAVFNPATGELISRLELDFAPTRVDTLGTGLFLLSPRQEAGDTLRVLDARQLAVYFIPAPELTAAVQ